jgi:hypothetical protein
MRRSTLPEAQQGEHGPPSRISEICSTSRLRGRLMAAATSNGRGNANSGDVARSYNPWSSDFAEEPLEEIPDSTRLEVVDKLLEC